MKLGERIKARRLELGLTQTEVGEMIGLTQSALQNIEVGKTARPRNINGLSIALRCSPEFLQYGINITDDSNVSNAISSESITKLPLISWVQAGCWSEIQELNYSDIDHFPCPVYASPKAFVLKVQGESMTPKFNEGDHIFVDPEAQAINGSYIVARLDDENQATFKQLILEGNKKYLKAINPDWPEKFIEINGNCTIVGKVIYKGEQYL